MLNLSILLVTLPVVATGLALIAVARYAIRKREARLALATVPVE